MSNNIEKTEFHMLTDRQMIGRGAFSTVYKANHRKWGIVAYKLLSVRGEFIDDMSVAFIIIIIIISIISIIVLQKAYYVRTMNRLHRNIMQCVQALLKNYRSLESHFNS